MQKTVTGFQRIKLPVLMSRGISFLFIMSLLAAFLYIAGSIQGFMDSTQLFLLKFGSFLSLFLSIMAFGGLVQQFFLIVCEGFDTPPLGAVKKVLNPEANTLPKQHTPLFAAGLLIFRIKNRKKSPGTGSNTTNFFRGKRSRGRRYWGRAVFYALMIVFGIALALAALFVFAASGGNVE